MFFSGMQLPIAGGQRVWAALHFGANFQTGWSQNVPLLAIDIMQQGDAGGAVRIVFPIEATFAGTPSLLRRKSIMRYIRL